MQGELRGCESDCNGSAQVMGGISGELAKARDGGFETGEKLVPDDGEVLDLVFCGRDREAIGEVTDADAQGRARHAADRLHGMAAEEVAADGREKEQAGHEQQQGIAILLENVGLFFEGATYMETDEAAVEEDHMAH